MTRKETLHVENVAKDLVKRALLYAILLLSMKDQGIMFVIFAKNHLAKKVICKNILKEFIIDINRLLRKNQITKV